MLKTNTLLLPVLGLALAGTALGQSFDSARFYKLDFVVKEVEGGKAINSRSFATMLAVQVPGRDAPAATIRAGGRVPVTTGNSTSFYELGVSIDTRELRETQADISVYVTADVSTGAASQGTVPVTRQNKLGRDGPPAPSRNRP